ncbi:MAG: ABC transporter permease [Candidatus Binatia bacterium]
MILPTTYWSACLRVLRESPYLAPLISAVLLLMAWQLVSMSVHQVILPAPMRVATSFVKLTQSGELPMAVLVTLWPLLEGLALACVAGVSVGLLLGLFPTLARLVDPYVFIFWSTPTIALLPLIIVWFGIDHLAQVIFVFLSAFFPLIINTEAGVRQVESSLTDVVLSLGGNKSEILRIVVIPSTLPYIFSGLRIAIGRSIVGIIIAQLLIVATGIGYMLQFYGETLQLHKYFTPLIVTALLAVALNQLLGFAERRIIRWKQQAFV